MLREIGQEGGFAGVTLATTMVEPPQLPSRSYMEVLQQKIGLDLSHQHAWRDVSSAGVVSLQPVSVAVSTGSQGCERDRRLVGLRKETFLRVMTEM